MIDNQEFMQVTDRRFEITREKRYRHFIPCLSRLQNRRLPCFIELLLLPFTIEFLFIAVNGYGQYFLITQNGAVIMDFLDGITFPLTMKK
jgi:hypothetical protein